MGEVRRGIAKQLVWMVIAGMSFTGCTPARYTYLNKVKSTSHKDVAKARIQEPLVVIQSDTSAGQDVIAGVEISGPLEEGLVASNEKKAIAIVKKHTVAYHAVKQAKIAKTEKAAGLREKVKTSKMLKAVSLLRKPVKADDYDTSTHRGLLWSLVAAVLLVWLIGVLFTNVGGLVHILLAVALILVVLNLLN